MGFPSTCSFPMRYTVILTSFIGFMLIYIVRINLSVAIVAMVNSTSKINRNETASDYQEGEFDWEERIQGLLLSAFFCTFGFGSLLGGRLSEKLGAKWILGGGVGGMCSLTMLTPTGARLSPYALLTLRLMEGLLGGMAFPALTTIVGRWMPRSERSFAFGIAMSGTRLGNMLGVLVTGLLCKIPGLGWPSTFYFFGIVGLVWFCLWMYVMHEMPSEHPRISAKELDFILESQGKERAQKNPVIPTRLLLSSVPVWAVAVANIADSWGMATVPTVMPLYLANILKYDVRESGLLSSIPSFLQFACMWLGGFIADGMITKKWLTRTAVRKLMSFVGQVLPAMCLVLVTFVGMNRAANVILLTLTLGFNGFVVAGYRVSAVDLAPDFAGTIMGLSVGVGNMIAFVSPYTVGELTNHKQTLHQWHIVFWIAAGFYAAGGLIFLIFGSSELQPWGIAQERPDKTGNANTRQKQTEMSVCAEKSP